MSVSYESRTTAGMTSAFYLTTRTYLVRDHPCSAHADPGTVRTGPALDATARHLGRLVDGIVVDAAQHQDGAEAVLVHEGVGADLDGPVIRVDFAQRPFAAWRH